MKKIIVIVFMLLFSNICYASPETEVNNVITPDEAYQKGYYNDAVNGYRALLKDHPNNFAILYNIGNAYFKQQKLGEAITYYRRALKWNPRDQDLRYNLAITQSQVVDKSASNHFVDINRIVRFISFNESVFFTLFLWSILLVLLTYWIFFARTELLKSILIFMIVGVVGSSVFSGMIYYEFFYKPYGVITHTKVAVKSGPADRLTTLFFVHDGMVFFLEKTVDGWAEIKLENGFTGWVAIEKFNII